MKKKIKIRVDPLNDILEVEINGTEKAIKNFENFIQQDYYAFIIE